MSDESGARRPGGGGHEIPGFDQLSRIGSGGSSTVYRAVDVRHQRRVAIKVLDAEASTGPRRTAFQREIEAIGRIGNHPNIVTVLGSGFTPGHHPYLVLPLFERGTYGELVDEHGPLTWAEAVDIGIKLASAVETVHRAGVVHRDIKPGNVFVGVTREQPLLADFGISSTVDGEPTRTQTMAVTFGYTAPEVLDDQRPTPASDIYSLAMTIFRLIQGLHAYHAETPAAVMRKVLGSADRPQLSAGVPPDLAEVVAGALAREPTQRPATALALARRLQRVQLAHGLPVTGVIVADEPGLPVDSTSTTTSALSSAAAIESTMLAALANRNPPAGQANEAAPGDVDDPTGARPPESTGRGRRGPAPRPTDPTPADPTMSSPGGDPAGSGPAVDRADSGGQRTVPLDLPTVVTPRQPRAAVQNRQPEVETRPWWRPTPRTIVLLILLLIPLLALAVFYFSLLREMGEDAMDLVDSATVNWRGGH
ncbi:MAG: protein kinase [Acidimicrobiia bacterium]|nr:protein kinase [Acidimicrobiia bacterium]